MIERRGFLSGLIALCTAPAIVRVGSIMPVKVMPEALPEVASDFTTANMIVKATERRNIIPRALLESYKEFGHDISDPKVLQKALRYYNEFKDIQMNVLDANYRRCFLREKGVI